MVNVARFDPSLILQNAQSNYYARQIPAVFGASLTLGRGQSLGRKNADGKLYAFNPDASDGTQTWQAFCHASLGTDAAGLIYYQTGITSAAWTVWTPSNQYGAPWAAGIFNPNDVYTAPPTGSAAAEVDTVVIGGTLGATDAYTINSAGAKAGIEYDGGNTNTSSVAVEMANMWNADPALSTVSTATVSNNTVTLTGLANGYSLGLTVGKTSTSGTITLAQTTPPVTTQTAEVDTWTLTTAPSTGDVVTATITYPGLQTAQVQFVVGATATIAAITAGLQAAWNNNNTGTYPNTGASAYATATSTGTTFVLTSANAGSAMSVSVSSSGSTTFAKVVSPAALGRNIADIQNNGRPGAYVDPETGYWIIP